MSKINTKKKYKQNHKILIKMMIKNDKIMINKIKKFHREYKNTNLII